MSKRSRNPAKSATSQAVSQEFRKPRADVYTLLLVVALLILIIATAALWMLMKDDYNYMIKGGPNLPTTGMTFAPPNGLV